MCLYFARSPVFGFVLLFDNFIKYGNLSRSTCPSFKHRWRQNYDSCCVTERRPHNELLHPMLSPNFVVRNLLYSNSWRYRAKKNFLKRNDLCISPPEWNIYMCPRCTKTLDFGHSIIKTEIMTNRA